MRASTAPRGSGAVAGADVIIAAELVVLGAATLTTVGRDVSPAKNSSSVPLSYSTIGSRGHRSRPDARNCSATCSQFRLRMRPTTAWYQRPTWSWTVRASLLQQLARDIEVQEGGLNLRTFQQIQRQVGMDHDGCLEANGAPRPHGIFGGLDGGQDPLNALLVPACQLLEALGVAAAVIINERVVLPQLTDGPIALEALEPGPGLHERAPHWLISKGARVHSASDAKPSSPGSVCAATIEHTLAQSTTTNDRRRRTRHRSTCTGTGYVKAGWFVKRRVKKAGPRWFVGRPTR